MAADRAAQRWIGFCELATGHLLPNTYYVKAGQEVGAHGLATSLGLLVQRGWAQAIAQRVDWLAIYPVLQQLYPAFSQFVRRQWFTIPKEEYTICDCAGPTRMFIAQRPSP